MALHFGKFHWSWFMGKVKAVCAQPHGGIVSVLQFVKGINLGQTEACIMDIGIWELDPIDALMLVMIELVFQLRKQNVVRLTSKSRLLTTHRSPPSKRLNLIVR
jgi:hypothetical protein